MKGEQSRSGWFYVSWSLGFLVAAVFLLPIVCTTDTGPTFSHFQLPGALICTIVASICTWAFLAVPLRPLVPKFASLVLLFLGLFVGVEGVLTYVFYTLGL